MRNNGHDDDIPRYVKKKNSSVSRASEKSRHKHVYRDCLITDGFEHLKCSYCTVCGKISNVCYKYEIPCDDGYSVVMMSDREIVEKYKDLPQFRVYSLYDKYITGFFPED